MKPAGNDTRIIRDSEGKPYALFLAGNYAAEHENGIRGILRHLNIDPNGTRLEGRSMKAPVELITAKGQATHKYYIDLEKPKKQTDKVFYVAMDPYHLEKRNIQYDVTRYKLDTEFTAAWDENSFKFAAWTKEATNFLQEIVNAASNSDLTVYIGQVLRERNNPFSRYGLLFAITSRMPQEAIDLINKDDDESERINSAVNDTGIVQKIKDNADKLRTWAHGPAYHALSPRWIEKHKSLVGREGNPSEDTKHPVIFYLNPGNQKKYNSGWFTVEELELWLEDKGPVIKTEEKAT